MPDPTERFIAAAVRPLEDDAELQLAAAQELRARVTAHPGHEASLAATTAAMERRSLRWRWLYAVSILAAALTLVPIVRDYLRMRVAAYMLLPLGSPLVRYLPDLPMAEVDEKSLPKLFGNPPPADQLLLFGDLQKPVGPERRKTRWDQEPDNPALFADFALSYIDHSKKLPPDFIATADRLDPGNSWFRYLAATTLAQGAVRDLGEPTPFRKRKDPLIPRFAIADSPRLNEALRLFEEANRLPSYRSYRAGIALQVNAALPAGDDFIGRHFSSAYLQWRTQEGVVFGYLGKVISQQAESRMIAGDKEGLRALIVAWERFGYRALTAAGTDEAETARAIGAIKGTLPHFLRAAQVLEVEPERSKLQQLKAAIEVDARVRRDFFHTDPPLIEAGNVAGDALGSYELSTGLKPELSKAELKPGRLLEHDFFARLCSTAGCFVMGFMALLTFPAAAMKGRWLRRLSFCLQRGLRPSDHFWTIAAAVGPLLLYEVVNFTNPWGGRSRTLEIGQGLQLFAAASLSILLPARVAQTRLAGNYRSLGWRHPFPFQWLFPLLAVLLGALSCLTLFSGDDLLRFLVAVGGGILLLLSQLLLGGGPKELPWATLAHAIRPAYAAAALFFAASAFLHHGLERYWTARDRIAVVEPGIPAPSALDFQAARHLQQKFLQLFGETFQPEAISSPPDGTSGPEMKN